MEECYSSINKNISDGYKALAAGDYKSACDKWLAAFEALESAAKSKGVKNLFLFDNEYSWDEMIYNWLQDLEMELWNAKYHQERYEYCKKMLNEYEIDDDSITENMRRALAEAMSQIGMRESAIEEYKKWLADDPTWGMGHVGYAEMYTYLNNQQTADDLHMAIQIFDEALSLQELRDKDIVEEHAADVYQEAGLVDKAAALTKKQARPTKEIQPQTKLAPKQTTIVKPAKVGRNDLCPCGSGKKYKKCCG